MSRSPAWILGASATVALMVAPFAIASPAAAAPAPQRQTLAVLLAQPLGSIVELYSQQYNLDGRSTRSLRQAMDVVRDVNDMIGFDFLRVTGVTDADRDGLDDDAKVALKVLDNVAILTLHRRGAVTVTDGGFVFRNRRSVLKESAQSFDRVLRFAATGGMVDTWDMRLIKELKVEMPTGVRVVSDHDGNRDGYDDDGRLTFLANGKAVTLTIGNTGRQLGHVTYGPTWRTRAPRRTHHPVAPPYQGSAFMAKQSAALGKA